MGDTKYFFTERLSDIYTTYLIEIKEKEMF